MKAEKRTTKIIAGILCLTMLFSSFAGSAGAVLAEELTPAPQTAETQEKVVPEENTPTVAEEEIPVQPEVTPEALQTPEVMQPEEAQAMNLMSAKSLSVAETIDSTAEGVDIQMFDYGSATPGADWGGYDNGGKTQGMIKQGLLEKELNQEGIPVRKDTKDALNASFSAKKNKDNYKGTANHLFLKEKFNKDRTFYYSSFENYAYWNQGIGGNNEFTVYEQLGTPDDSSSYVYQRGNFMPYNNIIKGNIARNAKNRYDEDGNLLSKNDLRYEEDLYLTQGTNYHFGMVMTANFAQLKGGMYNDNPMIYEFNGDDDMWVFIDGVLVLDIGGIHDAHSGSINFATGDVKWYDCKTGETPEQNETTIKDQFNGTSKEKTTQWNGNTFADYTGHEMKIFYMERGAGASNCKIKFNLPVVPKDSITVAKEVTNINEGSYSDVNFNFKLYLEDETGSSDTIEKEGKTYYLAANTPYQLKEGSDTIGRSVVTGGDGIFTLRHGQMATFNDISESGKQYIVQEVDVEQDHYDDFTVNGKAEDENGYEIVSTTEEDKFIVQTCPLTVGTDTFVKVQNSCNSGNLHDLDITKKMVKGQTSDKSFDLQVKIGGQLFERGGKYKIGKIDRSLEEKTLDNDDGIIKIKVGETIKIPQIAADTSFEITEVNYDTNKYETPVYEVANANITSTDNKASGTIIFEQNPQITITNAQIYGSLKITKTIDRADYIDGDPIFTFKITGPEDLVLYRTLRLSETVGKTASVTIDNLPIGDYTVEELKTMRYTCEGATSQTKAVKKEATTVFDFVNKLTNEDYFSHTDVVENSFKIDENGTVTCEQNKVPADQQSQDSQPNE